MPPLKTPCAAARSACSPTRARSVRRLAYPGAPQYRRSLRSSAG
ncbi:hypothetical protein QNM99_15985 [Pseudomonas sp. PCH446]